MIALILCILACSSGKDGPPGTDLTDANCVATEHCNGLDDDCDGSVDEDATDATTWYTDMDRDGYGVEAVLSVACEAPAGAAEVAGDCDDTSASVHPGADEDPCIDRVDQDCDGLLVAADTDGDGWDECEDCDDARDDVAPGQLEVCEDGLDQDCSGENIICGLWGAMALADSALRLEGDGDSWAAGIDVGFAHNLSGDGAAALLIGASHASEGTVEGGAAYVVSEVQDGAHVLGEAASAALLANNDGDILGFAVADLGDADGDGYGTIGVGAPGVNGDVGAVYLVSGPWQGSRLASEADAVLSGRDGGDYAGYAVDDAGDVDGDGFTDLAVGAATRLAGGGRAGEAYLVLGPPRSMGLQDAHAVVEPAITGGYLGWRVAGAGDLDGDGLAELAIGWPRNDYWREGGGAVIVLSDPSGTVVVPDTGAAIYDDASAAATGVGYYVAPAGDLDEDGLGDLLVGERDPADGYASAGGVYVLHGPIEGMLGLSAAASRLLGVGDRDEADNGVGEADLDADGHLDLIIGAPGGGTGSRPGAVYVVYGPIPEGTTSLRDADANLSGEEDEDAAGFAAALGDLNNDGFHDILVGGYNVGLRGAVWLAYGGN